MDAGGVVRPCVQRGHVVDSLLGPLSVVRRCLCKGIIESSSRMYQSHLTLKGLQRTVSRRVGDTCAASSPPTSARCAMRRTILLNCSWSYTESGYRQHSEYVHDATNAQPTSLLRAVVIASAQCTSHQRTGIHRRIYNYTRGQTKGHSVAGIAASGASGGTSDGGAAWWWCACTGATVDCPSAALSSPAAAPCTSFAASPWPWLQ